MTRPMSRKERAAEEAVKQFGRIDVLVNNAGYSLLGNFEEMTTAEIERQFATNFYSSGCYVPLDNVAWIHSLLGLPINQCWGERGKKKPVTFWGVGTSSTGADESFKHLAAGRRYIG